MAINQIITNFTKLVIQLGDWDELDYNYIQNRIIRMIGHRSFDHTEPNINQKQNPLELVETLVSQAIENQAIGTSLGEQETLESQLTDLFTPSPSQLANLFSYHYDASPVKATNYFFNLCQSNNYIKTQQIKNNITFSVETEYGQLEVTINLSKPEKDSQQIISEQKTSLSYPKCMLCMENEGYFGHDGYPTRVNHRVIRMSLVEEVWGFQYSPYAYYNEHCIFFAEEHRPMKIKRQTFQNLVAIVEKLPHYFVGSNADLPIVGGSILAHDHYQGGSHTFAMDRAVVEKYFSIIDYPEVSFGILRWPLSVIRLKSEVKSDLIDAATMILEVWQNYSDPSVQVIAKTEENVLHHTITPILRKKNSFFEIDLVLRDNNCSEEFPDGIFHPHKDKQHIKKENIGLIEVMGFAVLPPRLAAELVEVEKYVLNKPNEIADYHKNWAREMKKRLTFSEENVKMEMNKEIGRIFVGILEDAGVFKRDKRGKVAFNKFIETLKKTSVNYKKVDRTDPIG